MAVASAAADCGTVPSGNGDLVHVVHRQCRPLADPRQASAFEHPRRRRAAAIEVGTGGEVLALAGEDHHPRIDILAKGKRRRFDVFKMGVVQRIGLGRPVERHHRHRAIFAHLQVPVLFAAQRLSLQHADAA